MKRTTTIRAMALLAIATTLMPFAAAGYLKRDTSTPVVFSMSPTPIVPGAKLSMEIDLSRVSSTNQTVTITTHTPANWQGLPNQVTIPAGQIGITFSAYVASDASGAIDATATCNGGSINTCSAVLSR